MRFSLSAGETAYLVLTHGEDQDEACIEDYAGADADADHRRLLASLVRPQHLSRRLPGGGDAVRPLPEAADLLALEARIVAAAQPGLPEAVPERLQLRLSVRLVQDAAFTVTAFVMLGYVRESVEFLRCTTRLRQHLRAEDG